MASLLGMRGRKLVADWDLVDFFRQGGNRAVDRDQLHLAEVVLEQVPDGNPNCGIAIRRMLDHLANAAGFSTSPSFDQNGRCVLR
jgi:hypothetical protein